MKKIIIFLLLFQFVAVFAESKKKPIFDPESVKVMLLSMNTAKSDFGPALIGDSLYFSSYGIFPVNRKNSSKSGNFYGLFVSQLNSEGNLDNKKEVVKQFSTNYHNGPVAWCPSTNELFITQSNLNPGTVYNPLKKKLYNLRIVIAQQKNGTWEIKENFPYNNPQYSVGHPAISASGDTLIFSSNKPGGSGQTDLYLCTREKGKWSQPKNLGPKINSSGKEEFPFLTSHGELIFASDARGGFGGLDLYYTKLNDPSSEIYHFNSPVNSSYDDFSMIILPDKNYGYLSSNRPGYGDDDIYAMTFDRFKMNFLKLKVVDSRTRLPVSNAEIIFNDNTRFKTDQSGEITRNIEEDLALSLKVNATGFYDTLRTIQTRSLKSGEIINETVLLTEVPKIKEPVKEKYIVNNIYFDLDKYALLPDAQGDLDHLAAYLVRNPETKVSLSSHADARGSQEYNLKLSKKRMVTVVNYLTSKGISQDRIEGKFYGEAIPVNNCFDHSKCSPTQLRLNRRVEFYIPGLGKSEMVDQGNKGDYTIISEAVQKNQSPSIVFGSFMNTANAEKLMKELRKVGMQAEIVSRKDYYIVKVGFKDQKSAKAAYQQLKVKYQEAVLL